MADTPAYKFDDGAAYEQFMSPWSRKVGDIFIDWLNPSPGLNWVDVGCGNGAFTELICERCAPSAVSAIDPSEGQLAYARQRATTKRAVYTQGDAMALPYADKMFDVAAMALVIFFVPDPAKSIREMARVTKPGGQVATYAWDVMRGGAPMAPASEVMRDLGISANLPPSADASRIEILKDLWAAADLQKIETREIVVERTFENFETYWTASVINTPNRQAANLPEATRAELKRRLQARLPCDASGRISFHSRATAIKGRLAT